MSIRDKKTIYHKEDLQELLHLSNQLKLLEIQLQYNPSHSGLLETKKELEGKLEQILSRHND